MAVCVDVCVRVAVCVCGCVCVAGCVCVCVVLCRFQQSLIHITPLAACCMGPDNAAPIYVKHFVILYANNTIHVYTGI